MRLEIIIILIRCCIQAWMSLKVFKLKKLKDRLLEAKLFLFTQIL